MLLLRSGFEVGPRQFNLFEDEVGVHNRVPSADATSFVNRRDVFQDVPKTSFVPKGSHHHGQREEEPNQEPNQDLRKIATTNRKAWWSEEERATSSTEDF